MTYARLVEKVRAFFVGLPSKAPCTPEEIATAIGVPYDQLLSEACDDLYHEGFLTRQESVTGPACWYARIGASESSAPPNDPVRRPSHKDPSKEIEDLEKAVQVLQFEIARLRRNNSRA